MIPKDKTRRVPVYVVLPQQTMLLDVAGPLEVLRAAQREQTAVKFEVRYVGPNFGGDDFGWAYFGGD